MNSDQMSASHLPTPLLSPAVLLQRTQTALGLIREVVQESSAEYWYEQGIVAMKPGSIKEAMYSFQKCIMIEHNHWRATLQLAIVLAAQTSDATATMFRQAILPYYNGDISWISWSEYYCKCPAVNRQVLQMGLELSIASHGDNPEVWLSLALVYEASSCYSEAEKILTYLEENHEIFAKGSLIFIIHFAKTLVGKDNQKALELFNSGVSLSPNLAIIYQERGWVLENLRRYEEAHDDYTKSINLNNSSAYRSRARLMEWLRSYNDSIRDLSAFIDIYPMDKSALYERAAVREKAGDEKGASLDLQKAKEIN